MVARTASIVVCGLLALCARPDLARAGSAGNGWLSRGPTPAKPAGGSIFTGWDGCDSVSSARCKVVMNEARKVDARFLGLPLRLW